VNPDDLKRVWSLMQEAASDHGPGIGIDAKIISQQCAPATDVNAVFFRGRLLSRPSSFALGCSNICFSQGCWMTGARGDFIERLRSEEP
jgi:hypothetical protein